MRLAVFGGTGLAGAAVTRMAIENGHQVRALVRSPGDVSGADVIRGDALDPDAVARTIAGTDAVVSTLGGFRGPESIATGTQNIIAAMRETGLRRLVVLQGFHVEFPGDPKNLGKRFVEAYLALSCRPLLPYGAALGELLRATEDVSWTLVRIPRIVDEDPSGRARMGTFALGPFSSVRLGDIATCLIELAENDSSVHEAPMLHTPRAGFDASRDASLVAADRR